MPRNLVTRPTEESLAALRDTLPPFALGWAPSPALLEFCRFYGIDLASELPGVEHHCGLVPSGNFRLAVHLFLAPAARGTLVLVHGYYDHCGLYGKLYRWALEQGYNVLGFDLPGHGLSSGQPAVIEEFAQYGRALHDVLQAVDLPPLPLWVMAQSTGCAALIEFARHHPWPFAAAVLLAPLIRPGKWTALNLAFPLVRKLRDSVPRSFARNSTDEAFLLFVRDDPLQSRVTPLRWFAALRNWLAGLELRDLGVGPALVIQGQQDHTVAWRYNMKHIGSLFPGSHIEYLPDAGHQLANESASIREQYLQRVSAYLGNLPAFSPRV